MNYARAIRTVSAARGLSQKQLAERSGVPEALLSRLGHATLVGTAIRRGITTTTLEKIAKALETPLYLLVLLASDVDDLGGDFDEANALALRILDVLIVRTPGR